MVSAASCPRFVTRLSSPEIGCTPVVPRIVPQVVPQPAAEHTSRTAPGWKIRDVAHAGAESTSTQPLLPLVDSPASQTTPAEIDPFYLFACYVEWERRESTAAGWELLAASQSLYSDTRAHALALLSRSRHLGRTGENTTPHLAPQSKRRPAAENEMKAPYGLEIIDNCSECTLTNRSFFCGCSTEVRQALDLVSTKSILPAGAILYVEGQAPRGVFIICSGRVNISTASREGKVLVLKTALPGEALGMSAAISGVPYETTAETATPCQVNFVDRKHFLELIQTHGETGAHAARSLSRDYQTAYRDIRDLVLTRSSAGKLARLLLSQSPRPGLELDTYVTTPMTHEEMAHRIGSSRETVTRLLSDLRKKRLIRIDGASLIIQNRSALEALAV
jgi:CRP/FNR family transcriptional regulator, cyclic AMP receptor protein